MMILAIAIDYAIDISLILPIIIIIDYYYAFIIYFHWYATLRHYWLLPFRHWWYFIDDIDIFIDYWHIDYYWYYHYYITLLYWYFHIIIYFHWHYISIIDDYWLDILLIAIDDYWYARHYWCHWCHYWLPLLITPLLIRHFIDIAFHW
jgi:hypothetical protein